MIVAEMFHTYLKTTENWCYNLLRHLSGIDLLIVAENRENNDAFSLPNARYLFPFYADWRSNHPWLIQKLVNRTRLMLGPLWRKNITDRISRADIMHAHFSVIGWDYLGTARRAGIPLVISFYGFDYEYLPNIDPVWNERYRKLFQQAALFITEGTEGRNKLIRMGCPAHKVKVVRLGVDVAAIPFYNRPKKKSELNLVQIARFTDKKGQDTTVNAFIDALKDCPNMTLTLVGKDPYGIRARLKSLVQKSGVGHAVRFLDVIEYSKLYPFLLDFHVFIHPSRYGAHRDSEGGAPIVLLDAQATGMPVLSTFHCDIPDEVVNGQTGVLVRENDAKELAAAIRRFYTMDESEYHAFARRGREHVAANYEVRQCATELKKTYEGLLSYDRARNVT